MVLINQRKNFSNIFNQEEQIDEDLPTDIPYKELLKRKQASAQTEEEKKMYTPLSKSELEKINESDIIE